MSEQDWLSLIANVSGGLAAVILLVRWYAGRESPPSAPPRRPEPEPEEEGTWPLG